jgi:hypothetical protein
MERVSIFISRDEAPAATCGGSTGKRILTARKSSDFPESGPTSLVAAEIHLGRTPAGIHGGWLHCNIQVVCQLGLLEISLNINGLLIGGPRKEADLQADLRARSLKTSPPVPSLKARANRCIRICGAQS